MLHRNMDTCPIDEAPDARRFVDPTFDSEAPTHPGVPAYDLRGHPGARSREHAERRHQIRALRKNILRLRERLTEGWDIAPELAHEERQLAALIEAARKAA